MRFEPHGWTALAWRLAKESEVASAQVASVVATVVAAAEPPPAAKPEDEAEDWLATQVCAIRERRTTTAERPGARVCDRLELS